MEEKQYELEDLENIVSTLENLKSEIYTGYLMDEIQDLIDDYNQMAGDLEKEIGQSPNEDKKTLNSEYEGSVL